MAIPIWLAIFVTVVVFGLTVFLVVLMVIAKHLKNRNPGRHAAFAPRVPRQPQLPPMDPSEASAHWVASITQRFCPQCRAPLAVDSPEGLCPACLLAQGMAGGAGWNAAEGVPYSAKMEPAADGLAATTPPSGSHPPAQAEWADLAQHFPQLEILELLGRGGMGAVYKARQKNLDRMIALKVIPPEAAKDPAFAERFAREARALARLNHPSIVTVYDFGQIGDVYYLLMEYVDGVNLRHALRASRLAPQEALAIVPQICDALQYAHDQGVVHRDIKPENVLLDRSGRVKIADFGLAKLLGKGPDDFTLTSTQQVMGTPRYMAPEQIERPSTVDHRADIYSLGVVLYEMLTGELPLGRFEPPSHKVQVDVRIDQVVLRTLEKEPERRYQRASQVKTELASAASWPTSAASLPQPAWQTPPPATKQASSHVPGGVPLRLVLTAALGMVLGTLIVAAGLAVFAYGLMAMAQPNARGAWGWMGAAFGCICGGFGALFGSYNSYRQMAGAEDLLRSPSFTWFDGVLGTFLFVGLVLDVAALSALSAQGANSEAFHGLVILGGVATLQGAGFLISRILFRRGGAGAQSRYFIGLAIGMVLGFVMTGVGLALLATCVAWSLLRLPYAEQFSGAMLGSGFGLLVGGAGAFLGCWNAHRQLAGAVDLMRAPQVTWFDRSVAWFFALGVVLLVGMGQFPASDLENSLPLLMIGAVAMFQGGLTLLWRWVAVRQTRRGSERDASSIAAAPLDPAREANRRRVAGPATGLIVTGALGLAPLLIALLAAPTVTFPQSQGGVSVHSVVVPIVQAPLESVVLAVRARSVLVPSSVPLIAWQAETLAWQEETLNPRFGLFWAMTLAAIGYVASVPLSAIIVIGGWRMRQLKSYGLAVIASVLAMLPCTFGWIVGLPMGIWAFSVLARNEVRDAFET